MAIGVLGDGDYLMATGAVWTAVHYRVPLLMVINNNTSWYNDEEHQANIAAIRKRPPENAYIGTTTRDPDVDLAKNAESHGAVGIGPITEPGDLAPAFKTHGESGRGRRRRREDVQPLGGTIRPVDQAAALRPDASRHALRSFPGMRVSYHSLS